MRLKKSQKEAVLTWIAEGLRSDEINARALQFETSFQIDRRQVDYYRRTRKADLEAINKISEQTALIEGYALKEHRVYKLSMLAALMEKDILGGFLWTDDVKGVGSGTVAEVVDYEVFNAAEVIQYRGVLDDIAKETGGRPVKQEHTGADGGAIVIEWSDVVGDKD
jgi:hypothetical protein